MRFLRSENSYLKGQDLFRAVSALPPLPDLIDTSDGSSEDESEVGEDDYLKAPPTSLTAPKSLRALDTASKVLYRDLLTFSSSPRVVDLSAINSRIIPQKLTNGKAESNQTTSTPTRGWVSQKNFPHQQLWERSREVERLQDRLNGLTEHASLIAQAQSSRRRIVSKLS